jgi:hypothetical protein
LRLITAIADFDGSAALWVVTLTVCAVLIADGAMYNPVEEIAPVGGSVDQMTAVLLLPKTAAVNCCASSGPRLVVTGLMDSVTA